MRSYPQIAKTTTFKIYFLWSIFSTFAFSAIADFFGRKTSFYIGCASVIVFTLCMIPVSYSFTIFAIFKVSYNKTTYLLMESLNAWERRLCLKSIVKLCHHVSFLYSKMLACYKKLLFLDFFDTHGYKGTHTEIRIFFLEIVITLSRHGFGMWQELIMA